MDFSVSVSTICASKQLDDDKTLIVGFVFIRLRTLGEARTRRREEAEGCRARMGSRSGYRLGREGHLDLYRLSDPYGSDVEVQIERRGCFPLDVPYRCNTFITDALSFRDADAMPSRIRNPDAAPNVSNLNDICMR